ncbi:hypothetical protein ACFU96_21630 [Streptomyces sp. NPDC057620]|uniref:hypothetical protein n=1 Tax=Streptomyces sp. NPDC057620 TaxID=3346185 RepID=UPI0036B3AFA0
MTDFHIDPNAAPLGFVVNPQTGHGAATGGNAPSAAAGYCTHCGRGDLAPTADEYEQQRQRADQAEAALREVLDAFEAYWARASYCGPDASAVQPEHFQAWRAALAKPGPAATEATRPGVLSFDRRLTDAEVEEIKARWRREYGNNQGAHHVAELRPADEEPRP